MPDLEHDLEQMRSALLSPVVDDRGLAELAGRYAAACREVNERLRRCDDLLKRGYRSEALQEAQLAPGLLDHFALLDFPEREQWTAFAQQCGLPAPPPLHAQLAVEVNQAFAEAESMKDSVKRLRLLALARAPIKSRLQVMRRLAQLDPLSPLWLKDLPVFERVRLQEIEREVRKAESSDDLEALRSLFKELTIPGWVEAPPAFLVRRVMSLCDQRSSIDAQKRLALVEERLTAAVLAGDKPQARSIYQEAAQLRDASGLSGDHPLLDRLSSSMAWVEQQDEREVRKGEWREACRELAKAWEKDAPAAMLKRLEAKVLAFELGMPQQLEDALRESYRAERSRRRRRKLLLLLFLFALLLGAGAFLYFRFAKKPTLAAEKNAELAEKANGLLKTHCYRCHGGEKTVKGLNVLDRRSLLTKRTGKDIPPVTPGKLEQSLVWTRLSSEDDPMPPETEKIGRPDKAAKEIIREWIAAGAPEAKVASRTP